MTHAPFGSHLYRWGWIVVVFVVSFAFFARQRADEPYFMDEGAYLAETYFYRLMKEGRWNDVDWFHPASYDHLNVGRVIIGSAVDFFGFPLPDSLQAMDDWYGANGTPQRDLPPGDGPKLSAARFPMLLGGALGCAALFVIGRQLVGPFTGLVAALLLALSPVYAIHARRAMPDDWMITFNLAGLALILFLTKRLPLRRGWRFHLTRALPAAVGSGVCLGLAAGTKLSALTLPIALVVGSALILLVGAPWRQKGPSHYAIKKWGVVIVLVMLMSAITFIASQPFLYARPELPTTDNNNPVVLINGVPRNSTWIDQFVRPLASAGVSERLRFLIESRQATLDNETILERFPKDALRTPSQRWHAIISQGMGRWSYAARTGASHGIAAGGVVLLCLSGWIWCISEGRRHWQMGLIPFTWIVAAWGVVEIAVLARQLHLDWDRYYLGLVAVVSLLSALGIGGPIHVISRRLVLLPPVPEETPTS